MNSFAKAAFAFWPLLLLLSGCGAKEGAEFYALQKQDNQLQNTVSNLQIEVDALVAENNRLSMELATNSQAINRLTLKGQQQEIDIEKLKYKISRIRSGQ